MSADKSASDAAFNDKLDDYKFMYEMGTLTKMEYVNYLGVTEAGGKLCYDGRVANKHVMVREQLNFVDERVGF